MLSVLLKYLNQPGIDGQHLSYEILLDVLVQLYSANDAPNLGSDGSVESNHGGQSSDGVVDSSIPTLRFPQDLSKYLIVCIHFNL